MQYPRLVMATVSVAAGSVLLDPPSMFPPTHTGLVHWQIHILQIPLLIQSITYKERSQLWKKHKSHHQYFLQRHMGQIPHEGENEQNVAFFFYFMKLHCD